jgi:hypothetical protein
MSRTVANARLEFALILAAILVRFDALPVVQASAKGALIRAIVLAESVETEAVRLALGELALVEIAIDVLQAAAAVWSPALVLFALVDGLAPGKHGIKDHGKDEDLERYRQET